ncbi:MAG: hypothetical protein ACP5N1_01680 [Candidatus Woesearchaeota archaeon]
MNKKALSTPSTLATFILVFLLVFGLIVLYTKVVKGNTTVLLCEKNGGECVKGTCDFGTQLPMLSDKAAGCKSGELCCINITQSVPIDLLCENKTEGDKCGDSNIMYCGASKTCIPKCDFCNNHQEHADCKDIEFKRGDYSCQCSSAQCTPEQISKGNCITNLCPSDTETASDYRCCNIK